MGAPRLNRKKYERPNNIWDVQRLAADNALMKEYGLKSMREIWRAQTELSKMRRNVRQLLSEKQGGMEGDMIGRLVKRGIAQPGSSIEALLDLDDRKLLERRLESVVFRKGLAKSMLQARQLITHGFIAINGKRVRVPGYIVSVGEELGVNYYKPISIELQDVKPAERPGAAPIAGNADGNPEGETGA